MIINKILLMSKNLIYNEYFVNYYLNFIISIFIINYLLIKIIIDYLYFMFIKVQNYLNNLHFIPLNYQIFRQILEEENTKFYL